MKDTPPHIERLFRDLIMQRTPEERFAMGLEMFDASRRLMLAGLGADDSRSVPERLFLRCYGSDFDAAARERILAAIRAHHAGA